MLVTRIVLVLSAAALLLFLSQLFFYSTNDQSPWLLLPKSHHSQNTKINTTVLFMITSYAQEFTGRQIVRETYLSVPSDKSAYLFILGNGVVTQDLLQEQAKYKDMYFLDCADGYYDLSDKVLMGMKIALEHFDFQYLVKVDTDTFVDVPRFVDYVLEQGANSTTFYAGNPGHYKVKESGWRTLNTTIRQPSMRPSDYMLGGGYVLSRDLVEYFAENGHMLQVWEPEDLTIGVHLHAIKVKRHSDYSTFLTHNKKMGCKKDYLLNHKVPKADMYYLHYSTLESGQMCGYVHSETVRNAVHQKIKASTSDTLKLVLTKPSPLPDRKWDEWWPTQQPDSKSDLSESSELRSAPRRAASEFESDELSEFSAREFDSDSPDFNAYLSEFSSDFEFSESPELSDLSLRDWGSSEFSSDESW
eukprot:Phypoly_transcript_08259.p1 GENE.Phypoly_transcript_08259~~Phypoly_transcript_08259.p1  ORF type:complete len:416 (-),score=52.94 Phypoly_transcript_08259:210-1457(-)